MASRQNAVAPIDVLPVDCLQRDNSLLHLGVLLADGVAPVGRLVAMFKKLFSQSMTLWQNKLECLVLASFFSVV